MPEVYERLGDGVIRPVPIDMTGAGVGDIVRKNAQGHWTATPMPSTGGGEMPSNLALLGEDGTLRPDHLCDHQHDMSQIDGLEQAMAHMGEEQAEQNDTNAAMLAAISAEATSRAAGDQQAMDAVTAEAAARSAEISSAAAQEASDRAAAIAAHAAAETSTRNAAISTAVSSEAAARETAISDAVAEEAAERSNAISAHATAESAARGSAISSAVAAESAARNAAITSAVNAETAARNAAISAAIGQSTRSQRVAIPAIALLQTIELPVSWSPAMPDASYAVTFTVEAGVSLLGQIRTPTIKPGSQTAGGVTALLSTALALSAGQAWLHVTATNF